MLYREASEKIMAWIRGGERKALLVTGARQVGKTYLIRSCLREEAESFVEINFIEKPESARLFENASGAKDIIMRMSLMASGPLIPGKTIVFLDEIQECPDIVTALKFLVEDGSYRYVVSGSLLGVVLKDIMSVPVGYMDVIEMFPLNINEFFKANGLPEAVLDHVENAFRNRMPVDGVIHEKLMALFRLYMIVGGMPAAVQEYLDTNNIARVVEIQQSINRLCRMDISKYDREEKLHIEAIFDMIPSELNNQNKRFILKNMNEKRMFSYYEDSFLWLKNAGVGYPVYCASSPSVPLELSRSKNLFKLFLCDVGLLSALFMDGIQIRILNNELSINYGSVYENVVAQELFAHGLKLYYYRNKKIGEIDFLVELDGKVVPLEVKSGKDYKTHRALSNLLDMDEYDIPEAFVFSGANVSQTGRKTYLPIYMVSFLKRNEDVPGVYDWRQGLPEGWGPC